MNEWFFLGEIFTGQNSDDNGNIGEDDYSGADYSISGLPMDTLPYWLRITIYGESEDEYPDTQSAGTSQLPDLTETNGQLISPGSLTPEGSGQLLDSIRDGSLEFITITTQAGNVFFLIIDRARESNNVYFLAPVTEYYLMSLARQAGEGAGIQGAGLPGIIQEELRPIYAGQFEIHDRTPQAGQGGGLGSLGVNNLIVLILVTVVVVIVLGISAAKKKKKRSGLIAFADSEDDYDAGSDEHDHDEHRPGDAPPQVAPKLRPLNADEVFIHSISESESEQ